jgi:pimeloyl-ACP methyl ester carboxylesterase
MSDSSAPAWFHKAIAAPREDRFVEVAGADIHYLRWGRAGRPGLLFVHGGAAHAHWWAWIAPRFADDYTVAAIDLSGHGDSARRERYEASLWGDEILAVARDAEMDGPPVVVAHSMGGFIALAMASRASDQLEGVVILDSPVRRPDPEQEEGTHGSSFRNPKTYPDVATALRKFRTVPDQPSSEPWILEYVGRTSLRRTDDGWTWKFDPRVFTNLQSRRRPEILRGITCRVALFRAENGLVTPDIGQFMYEQLGRVAPVIEVPEAYHHIMLDQPLALVTGLSALLADWQHSTPRARRG